MTETDVVSSIKSDFLAAEAIKAILAGRDKSEQERIVRWVSESLELSAADPGARNDRAQSGAAEATSHQYQNGRVTLPADIRSFVDEKKPRTDIEFIVVAAYYYRFIAPAADRQETIGSKELQTAARLAQRPVFKTPTVSLNNAVKRGYLDGAGRGLYRVNTVGENLASITLPADRTAISNVKKRKPKSRAVGRVANNMRPKKMRNPK
jgi:hypothetical protein